MVTGMTQSSFFKIGEYALWVLQICLIICVIEKTEDSEISSLAGKRIIVGSLLLALIQMLLFHYAGFLPFFLLSFLNFFLYGCYAAKEHIGQKIVFSSFAVIFRALLIPVGDTLAICVFPGAVQPLNGVSFLTSLLLTDVFLLPIMAFMLRHKIQIKNSEKYLTYAGIAISVVLFFNLICLVKTMPGSVSNFIYNLGMILINLLCYYLFHQMIEGFHRELAYKIQIEQNRYEKKYVKDVYAVYEKQRRLKHDFNNHILCMKILLKEQEYQELDKYLGEIEEKNKSFQKSIATGNITADAILEQKYSEAEAGGIPVKLDISLPEQLPMKKMDFCAVVSNLFDNAIEASAIEEPAIWIEIKPVKGYLSFLFKNRVSEKIKNKKNILQTNKNPQEHGLGLKIVREIVDDYQGQMDIRFVDDCFSVRVLILLESFQR